MRKLAIIAGLVLIGLAALTTVALFNLSSLANSNKDLLIAQAEESLGRKVSLGELTVSLLDGVGIRAKNLAVTDDAAFSTEAFIKIAELRFTVRVWPLLWKEFRLKRLTVVNPVVTIIRDQQGSYNFASLANVAEEKSRPNQRADESRGESPSPRRAERSGRGALPVFLGLGKTVGAEVRYIDRKKNLDLTITRLDLTVKANDANNEFTADLAAAFLTEHQNLKITAKLGPVPAGDLADLPFHARAELAPLDLALLRQRLAPLLKLPQGLEIGGTVRLTEAVVSGSARTASLHATLDGSASKIAFPDRFQKPPAVPLKLSVEARLADGSFELRQTKLQLRDLEITSATPLMLRKLDEIDLSLTTNEFDLSGWDQMVPALQQISMTGRGSARARVRTAIKRPALRLSDLSWNLADFKIALPQIQKVLTLANATVRVHDDGAARSRGPVVQRAKVLEPSGHDWFPDQLSYNLSAAEITLASPRDDKAATQQADTLREVKSAGNLFLGNGRLAYQGQLSSVQGQCFNIDYKDLVSRLAFADQVLRVDDLKFTAMDGLLQGSGKYAFDGLTPSFAVTTKIRGLDIEQYARAVLRAEAKRLRGRLQLEATLAGKGNGWEEILATLDGRGAAAVTQGALLNFNLAQQILTKTTGIAGLRSLVPSSVRDRYPRLFNARDTGFDQLKGDFALTRGTARLKNVLLVAPDFGAKGEGRGDLTGRIDFAGTLSLSKQLTGDLVRGVKVLQLIVGKDGKLAIPFTLKGVLPKVEGKPDLSRLRSTLGQGLLGDVLNNLRKNPPDSPGQRENNADDRKRRQGKELFRKGLEWLLGR